MFNEFAKDINNDGISGTVFIYGEENYLIRWAVSEMIDKYAPFDERELKLVELYGDNIKASDIINAASTYSIVGGRRLVLVHNFMPLYNKADASTELALNKIIDFASSNQNSSILVFELGSEWNKGSTKFKKNLIKVAKTYKMSRLNRNTLRAFIIKRLKTSGKYMSKRDIEDLIDMTGYLNRDSEYSIDEMDKDLRKIVESTDDVNITAEDAVDIMTGDEDKFIFNLIDELMKNNNGKAFNMFLNILAKDKDASMGILSLLTSQFEMMYDSLELEKEGLSIKTMANKLSVNEFRLRKAYKSAKRFSNKRLMNILTQIYNIDRDIKIGDISADDALGLFLLDV